MKIYTLIEDSKHANTGFINEHGLSLYFEHNGQRVLFDTGASDAFIYNATLFGIDLLKVDICVISHVHNDHTGGLGYFLDINRHAKVYIKKAATGDFYSKHGSKNIRSGIDPLFFEKYWERFCFFDGDIKVAKGVFAASAVKHRKLPNYSANMLAKKEGMLTLDTLEHELFLVIEDKEGIIVLTGCAHNGILNILMTAEEKYGKISGTAGGFHLGGYSGTNKKTKREPDAEVAAIARFLTEHKIKKVYTGHCTGDKAFEKLSMLARVKRMRTGDILEF